MALDPDRTKPLEKPAQKVARNLFDSYLNDPNIVGTALGAREVHDQKTDEPALLVMVARKVDERFLPPSRVLPKTVVVGGTSVRVDVRETGFFFPFSWTFRQRPAPNGICCGHYQITWGTLGALVRDRTDGTICILSNNHVLANQNNARIGDPILQPGPAAQGQVGADTIARLKRFVPIHTDAPNYADVAIAAPVGSGMVDNVSLGNVAPPNANRPAIGLLFAGAGCAMTVLNPIQTVLDEINAEFLAPDATYGPADWADIGRNIDKAGARTEYTSRHIGGVHSTQTVGYDAGSATFHDSILVDDSFSLGGDSGSVVCLHGDGATTASECAGQVGCATLAAAQERLGIPLAADTEAAKEFRDRVLRSTKTGRWLVDLFYLNEVALTQRLEAQSFSDGETAVVQSLYAKYVGELRLVAIDPASSGVTITDQHAVDAHAAVRALRRHLSSASLAAVHELTQIVHHGAGRPAAEVLVLLDEPHIYRRVTKAFSKIDDLQFPPI